jgi:hypothetical protein
LNRAMYLPWSLRCALTAGERFGFLRAFRGAAEAVAALRATLATRARRRRAVLLRP